MRARKLWKLTLVCGLAGSTVGCVTAATSGQGSTTSSGNKLLAWMMEPFSSKPALNQKSDPATLFTKKNKPGADLYVTMAKLREQAGDIAEAEKLYQKGLKTDPKSLDALMGYAHLEDRRGHLEAATKLYKRAIAAHPDEVSPYNDLGLCFHRQGRLSESAQTLRHAVDLQPERTLYRNNLATVLVDLDRHDEAFKELSATGSPAMAHYNLANLLHRKGDDTAAVDHFRQALAADPSMEPAQQWLAKLAPSADAGDAEALLAGRPSRRNRPENATPAIPVAAPGGSTVQPPAAPAETPAQQPPRASVRTVKADPPRPRRAASAQTPPQVASSDQAPPVALPAKVDANPAPEAPALDSADLAGSLPPAGRPDRPTAVGTRPSGRGMAPQAPSPPQFLYAEGAQPSAAPPVRTARAWGSRVAASAPAQTGPLPQVAGKPAADAPPLAQAQAAPPAAEPESAATPTLSLTSDRQQGTRFIKPLPDFSQSANSGRVRAPLSNKPPQILQAEDPAGESLPSAPLPETLASRPTISRQIKYPDRQGDQDAAPAPVPVEAAALQTAVAKDEPAETSSFIEPAEPSDFGR